MEPTVTVSDRSRPQWLSDSELFAIGTLLTGATNHEGADAAGDDRTGWRRHHRSSRARRGSGPPLVLDLSRVTDVVGDQPSLRVVRKGGATATGDALSLELRREMLIQAVRCVRRVGVGEGWRHEESAMQGILNVDLSGAAQSVTQARSVDRWRWPPSPMTAFVYAPRDAVRG